jgi:myosin heavy subunit
LFIPFLFDLSFPSVFVLFRFVFLAFPVLSFLLSFLRSFLLGFIGLLDIYGFENFDSMNSFEQLLINYANEKMQNHFNKHIFQIEQQEYENESIDWSYIQFYDNSSCLDLIDGKPFNKSGILQTLDDSSASGRQDANSSFLAAINMSWSGNNSLVTNSNVNKHPNFVSPRFNSDCRFGISHYAGEVFYEIIGFVEKNREATNNDMKDLMTKSSNSLLKSIAEEMIANDAASSLCSSSTVASLSSSSNDRTLTKKPSSLSAASSGSTASSVVPRGSVSKLKEDSVSKQFVNSLKCLFETLETTQPHFVRCIKPNTYKKADFFNGNETLQQLKYSGMLETIRIRQQGYALRIEHKDFYDRYHYCSPSSKTLKDLVGSLSKDLSVNNESWQVGTTKIFIRYEMSEKLERLLWLCYQSNVRKIQKFYRFMLLKRKIIIIQSFIRRFLAIHHYQRIRSSVILLQSMIRGYQAKKQYSLMRKAIIHIQSGIRGKLGRILLRKIRNPYNRMEYDELMKTYRSLLQDINKAFSEHDFIRCSLLESSLQDLQTVQNKLFIPKRNPSNRQQLEIYIMEMKFVLENLSLSSDISKTVSYYEEILSFYEKMKITFPTILEMENEIVLTQKELKIAMTNKQFKLCSELQLRLSSFESSLMKLKEESKKDFSNLSIFELKNHKESLYNALMNALNDKNFDLCNSLQVEIDNVEGFLKKKDLSLEIVDLKILELEKNIDESKERKDFLAMAELSIELKELKHLYYPSSQLDSTDLALNDLINNPLDEAITMNGSVPTKKKTNRKSLSSTLVALSKAGKKASRKELLSMKLERESQLQDAIKSKSYSLCDSINKEIDVIKIEIEKIPTYDMVCRKLIELEGQLKVNILNKKFIECEQLEKEIQSLTTLKEELASEEPPLAPIKSPSDSSKPTVKVAVKGAKVALKGSEQREKNKDSVTAIPFLPVKGKSNRMEDSKSNASSKRDSQSKGHDKPVSSLRPKAPVTASSNNSIFEVVSKMASNRVDAALLLDDEGMLSGIITDNDITRRVVAQFVDVNEELVDKVMTKSPKCVKSDDSALDALEMMVDNRFRHLPVLDKDGSVVGLLDIAKCLYNAITILEKVQDKEQEESSTADAGAVLAQAMTVAMKGKGMKNAAQLMAMKAMMESMFGGNIPTLRTILEKMDKVPFVEPGTSIRDAAKIMAEYRKGVLVMDKKGKSLLGIFTPKDLLTRVIAKGISPDEAKVELVMTSNPDSVSCDLTVLDALKEMHDHKYLHLPVVDENGKVLGCVDVMDLIIHSAGEDGKKGWRDFFKGVMSARGGDKDGGSETGSDLSNSVNSKRSKAKTTSGAAAVPKEHDKPVSSLRPKAPVTASSNNSIFEVVSKMASNRVDAALLLDDEGMLSGIITDNDITRRVVAQFVDVNEELVDKVMTKSPKCVKSDDSALDALEMMVDNRFRHLPVLDKDGSVVGLLDIAKCLYNAITILEKVQDKEQEESSTADAGAVLAQAMTVAMKGKGMKNAAQLMAMKAMMESMFGGNIPTLWKVIGRSGFYPSVRDTVNVREAATLMTKHRKGLLVEDNDGDIVGIITPKDIMMRVLAQSKSPDLTAVFSVMTPNPDFVSPDLTILEALREMYDQKYLHLPIKDEESGRVVGLVDVMDLITHSSDGSGKNWREFFRSAIASKASNDKGEDLSETASLHSNSRSDVDMVKAMNPLPIRTRYNYQQAANNQTDSNSDVFSLPTNQTPHPLNRSSSHMAGEGKGIGKGGLFDDSFQEINFKVTDEHDNIHKIKLLPNSDTIELLKGIISEKLGMNKDNLIIKYVDEDNDQILLNSNKLLEEAVQLSKKLNLNSIRLIVSESKKILVEPLSSASPAIVSGTSFVRSVPSSSSALTPSSTDNKNDGVVQKVRSSGNNWLLYGGGAVIVVGITIAALVLTKKKN